MMVPRPQAYITLGGNHSIGVGPDSELIYSKGSSRYNLGIKTQGDINRLCEYLQRLKIHFEPEPKP